MRIRQIKPAFWTDSRVAALPPAVRLFYVGLWMVADDGGWLRWDPAQIANELYGYEPRGRRERNVATFAVLLEEAGRIVILPCGHAMVPTLTEHQRLSGSTKQVRTVQKEHSECAPADPRASSLDPASPRPVRNGQVRPLRGVSKGQEQVAPARAPEGAAGAGTDFQRLVPRPGARP